MDRWGSGLDAADDVEGCLAAVHSIGLGALLTLDRPVLTAEIRRVGDQAKRDSYRYSAFASFVDVPDDVETPDGIHPAPSAERPAHDRR